jgi:hypothetical protein
MLEKVLLPTVRPGDIVVVDNPGSHKGKIVASAHPFRRRQAVLPAQILTRPEPHRTGLCQTQTSAPKGRRANR